MLGEYKGNFTIAKRTRFIHYFQFIAAKGTKIYLRFGHVVPPWKELIKSIMIDNYG